MNSDMQTVRSGPEGKSSEKISYLSQLPRFVLDRIIEHMTVKTLKRFRRTSREFEEYVRLNRHRFNFVTRCTAFKLSINEKLELDFGRGSTGSWKQRFELNGLKYIEELKLDGISAKDTILCVIPFLRSLKLEEICEWHVENMTSDAVLGVYNYSPMYDLTIDGTRFEEVYATHFVKELQQSPTYSLGYLCVDWSEDISQQSVLEALLKDVEYIKIWDFEMHSVSALQNIDVSQEEENGLLGVYMIKRNGVKKNDIEKGNYGMLDVWRRHFRLDSHGMTIKKCMIDEYLDYLFGGWDDFSDYIIEDLIPC